MKNKKNIFWYKIGNVINICFNALTAFLGMLIFFMMVYLFMVILIIDISDRSVRSTVGYVGIGWSLVSLFVLFSLTMKLDSSSKKHPHKNTSETVFFRLLFLWSVLSFFAIREIFKEIGLHGLWW